MIYHLPKKIFDIYCKINKIKYPKQINDIVDWFVQKYYKPLTIQYGASFINRYDVIYATRLHAAVLGLLLGKEVHIIDNSYGKISAFFSTWQDKL